MHHQNFTLFFNKSVAFKEIKLHFTNAKLQFTNAKIAFRNFELWTFKKAKYEFYIIVFAFESSFQGRIYFFALLPDLFVCFWDMQNEIWGRISWFCNCKTSAFNRTSNAFFESKNGFAWMLFVTFTFNIWVLKCRHLAACICKGKKHTFKSYFAHWHDCFAWNLKMSIVNCTEVFVTHHPLCRGLGVKRAPICCFRLEAFESKFCILGSIFVNCTRRQHCDILHRIAPASV